MRAPLLIVVLAVLAGAGVTLAQTQQAPVFRSTVEGVAVSVSVRRNREPVTGLTGADFRLLDNGVVQTIQSVSVETLPIDVTLLLDLSSSVEGARLERLKSSVRETAALLRPADRLRLISVQHVLREVFPFQPGGTPTNVEALTARGGTALFDGLTAALVRAVDPERRPLIIAYTDGQDTISALSPEVTGEIAGYSDAVINVVVPATKDPRAAAAGLNALTTLAARTGGQLFLIDTAAPITPSFVRAIEEFRTSYVLRYVPAGVAPRGWHELAVDVPGRTYEVRARRGYAIN
jgi:VWFA-related protein